MIDPNDDRTQQLPLEPLIDLDSDWPLPPPQQPACDDDVCESCQ